MGGKEREEKEVKGHSFVLFVVRGAGEDLLVAGECFFLSLFCSTVPQIRCLCYESNDGDQREERGGERRRVKGGRGGREHTHPGGQGLTRGIYRFLPLPSRDMQLVHLWNLCTCTSLNKVK